MRQARGWVGVAFVAISLSVVSGCSEGTRPVDRSTTETKVKGTVKLKGAPMPGGEVMFTPSAAGRQTAGAKTAKVNNDGTYEITTLVGRNDVRISGPAVQKDPLLGYATKSIDVQTEGGTVDLEFP